MQEAARIRDGMISPRGWNGSSSVSANPGLGHPVQGTSGSHGATPPSVPAAGSNARNGRKRDRSDMSRADVAYPRKRAVAACRLCRSRKVKCNNARPSCGNCAAHEALCVYEDSEDVSAYDPASIAILDKLSQVISRLDHLPVEIGQLGVLTAEGTVHSAATTNARCNPVIDEDPGKAQAALRNELVIPAAQTTPEAVLQWPILASEFPSSYMIDAVFEAEIEETDSTEEDESENQRSRSFSRSRATCFCEDDVMDLVQRFLDLVHIKNPVLEPETIWSYARRVVEDGLKWDSVSCLVLIACALGSVAQEFPGRGSGADPRPGSSLKEHALDLQRGEAYYDLARRRLGLLQKGLLAPQGHFLAGVYLMYTLRPLQAWAQFHSASRSYHIYLQFQMRRSSRPAACAPVTSSKRRRLEQRLYWSCYKSECELRAEMDLPNSSLAAFHYPDMHPSPPDMDAPSPEMTDQQLQGGGGPATLPLLGRHPSTLNQHQEESWYYYLTEITLRRIVNRILNAFYAQGYEGWTRDTICFMAKAAGEFERQLEEWYDRLPAIIRFDDDELPERELTYMVRGRVLEINSWLYRPFLFYVIHNPPDSPSWDMARPLADKAILWGVRHFSTEPIPHRHHGIWYGIRSTVVTALCTIAAARSGAIAMPPEWRATVFRCIERMRFWEDEAPGIARAVEILNHFMMT